MKGAAGSGVDVKHVVVIEEAVEVTDGLIARLTRSLELSEAKAVRLLKRVPGVVTKPIELPEAELIAERFRRAGFSAVVKPETLASAPVKTAATGGKEGRPGPAAPDSAVSTAVTRAAPDPDVQSGSQSAPEAEPPKLPTVEPVRGFGGLERPRDDETGFEGQSPPTSFDEKNLALTTLSGMGAAPAAKPPNPDLNIDLSSEWREETAEAPPKATLDADDYGRLELDDSSLWLRRGLLVLPAFLSILFISVYLRGGLGPQLAAALQQAPIAVTSVLASSLEQNVLVAPEGGELLGLRRTLTQLQPELSRQGVELALVTDAQGGFVAGWRGSQTLASTPDALINSLPQLIETARRTGMGAASLSVPAGQLSDSGIPLVLYTRTLNTPSASLVLSVATPDSAGSFVSWLARSSLMVGVIPILLTLLATLVFIRPRSD